MLSGPVTSPERAAIGFGEFVALMATLTALAAMSIDTVLPALPAIGASLAVARANDNQLVVSLFFLGFGVGQLFYGPLSDAAGRKPAAYVGLALFVAGSLLALLSRAFPVIQMPEKSGFPSGVRGVGADRLTVPSAFRGTPVVGYRSH